MATKSGGWPLNSLIKNNLKKGDATSAKSNRYWWNCNHCDTHIDGHNNNLFKHLMDAVKCSNCPQETHHEALQHLMKKPAGGKVALIAAVTSGDDEGSNASSLSLLVVEPGAVAPVHKQKKTTLDGFVDHPLNKDQKARADIKLLRLLDSEAARVKLEEVDRPKGRRLLTLLLNGWEDMLRRSLYGSLAAEVKQHPIILALEDMMGVHSVESFKLNSIGCSMNTLLGKIFSHGPMKKILSKTTRICLSVLEHQRALSHICLHPEAQKRVNGQTPIAVDVIETVIRTLNYWNYLDQMVRTTKFIVDAIGNIENRDCNLAECMLELIRCAHKMSTLQLDDGDDGTFFTHAKSVFNRRFHLINTKYHTLALFLHPMCCKLAVTQAASGRPFKFMVKVALEVAFQWKWKKAKADALIMDLKAYNLCHSPFAGGQADGLAWWENLPVNLETHPLKSFVIVILSIVPHAAEVEHLFSNLSGTQSAKCCNLSVNTFQTLGKIHANLRYHIHLKNNADGKPIRRRHAHMHTTEFPGIDTSVAKQLKTDFAFVPPLAAVSGDASCNLEGPKLISLDDIDAEFAQLEDIRNTEKMMDTEFLSDWDVDGKEVLEGNAFDFAELQRVDEGLVPAAVEDEIMVIDHDANKDGTWNIDSMLLSSGLTSM
ncbi:hypothetical protein EDB19DRAFT_1830154 [Suillus lakei]|nr:hypothetical protein EDB19DRAFT_1830154 [Suillus lakei]